MFGPKRASSPRRFRQRSGAADGRQKAEAPIKTSADRHARQTGEFYFGASGEIKIGIYRLANVKRIEPIWRREGLTVPAKQRKRKRLWLNDGSRIRLRPERPNHVWSCDFTEDRAHDGRKYRMLNIVDAFTRECLATRIDRKLASTAVIDALTDLFIPRGAPGYVRSDNGPDVIAKPVQDWIAAVGAKTAYIEPGSPWEKAIASASTRSSATSCTMAKSSIRRGRPGSSLKVGGGTATS
jgi:transposase InsO family protein